MADEDAARIAYGLSRVVSLTFSCAADGNDHVADGIEFDQGARELPNIVGYHNRSDVRHADA